jgi:hypothetical protein
LKLANSQGLPGILQFIIKHRVLKIPTPRVLKVLSYPKSLETFSDRDYTFYGATKNK